MPKASWPCCDRSWTPAPAGSCLPRRRHWTPSERPPDACVTRPRSRALSEAPAPRRYDYSMEFRRINGLPPYVFATIDSLKLEARRAGRDVIDLGFGNPDLPSPDVAVEKLAEAAHLARNHRYSSSRGIPRLRRAIADRYLSKFGVELD